MSSNLSAEEKQVRLTEIAKSVSDEVIRLSDKRQLEVWCKGLFPISKLRKSELVEKLIEILVGTRKAIDDAAKVEVQRLENERMMAEVAKREMDLEALEYGSILTNAELPDAIERRMIARQSIGADEATHELVASKLYKRIKAIAVSVENLQELREQLGGLLVEHQNKEAQIYTPGTQRFRKTQIKQLLVKNLESEGTLTYDNVKLSVDYFNGLYDRALNKVSQALNMDYKKRVVDRNKNLEQINGDTYLEFAERALTECKDWMSVSIALAVVTGRRMSELHGTDSTLEMTGDKTFIFTGQLKTKGRSDVSSYEIPVLLPGDLVMAGMTYLAAQGKRFVGTEDISTSDVVNKKVSMSLSRRMKGLFGNDRVYKDCRAVYAEICWILYADPTQMTKPAFFRAILGHGENDITTAQSYTKFAVSLTL